MIAAATLHIGAMVAIIRVEAITAGYVQARAMAIVRKTAVMFVPVQ